MWSRSLQVLDRVWGNEGCPLGARDGVDAIPVRGFLFFFLWVGGFVAKCLIAVARFMLPWRAILSALISRESPSSASYKASDPEMKPFSLTR